MQVTELIDRFRETIYVLITACNLVNSAGEASIYYTKEESDIVNAS